MTYDTRTEQGPAWPTPDLQEAISVFEQSSQELRVPAKRCVGRPPTITRSHLCLAIMHCFLRGWNVQLEVWRLIGSERVGNFAPVKVSDQAVYNRIEAATTALSWLFEEVSAYHLWSAKPEVVQVQLWCCLILAQVFHGLQVEIARQTGVEVFDVSLDLLIRQTPQWLSRGLTPLEQAVRFGRDIGLIRPSTRYRIEVPWVDPRWVVPPPPEAVQPRAQVRYRSYGARGTGAKRVGRVRLKHGILHLLE